jgi:hypothetical protein
VERRPPRAHPAHPEFRVWFDAGSGNLGISVSMTEMIVERIGRG